jgi:hypothetical protein
LTIEELKGEEVVGVRVVVSKLGRQRCRRIPVDDWKTQYGKALNEAMIAQPNNNRGKGREGYHDDKYCLLGKHFDYAQSKSIRPYASIKGMQKLHQKCKRVLIRLIKELEFHSKDLLTPADLRAVTCLREIHGFWQIMFDRWYGGRYAQMALTRQYSSPWHTDDDAVATLLCVYSPSLAAANNFDDILCYFILPTLHKAIPMRNADIILFDSTVGHCVTKCRVDDTFIFSLFTGTKTALTQMSANEAERKNMKKQMREDRFKLV